MAETEPSLRDQTFRQRSLRGSSFVGCDLSGVVVRGSDVAGMEIDSPWLLESGASLVVNGVDVAPMVDAELDRRFPGRALRTAEDPGGLRDAWAALERTWAATVERALAMPPGTIEASVDGEWSFGQTQQHLVMATDTWLRQAVLDLPDPHHPAGLRHDDDGSGPPAPPLAEVLEVRAGRQRMVREFLDSVTPAVLAEARPNPHGPEHEETVMSCLRTILEEEWEHHRYAVRDLEALAG